MCVQRLSVGAAAFLLLVLGMSSAWAQVGTAISHLSHKGSVWSSDQTPSKLGWGGDDRAYPDRFAVNPKDGAEMVWVPAGSFRMGSNEGQDNEKPVHSVRLGGFWIYRHEVTNAQFGEFAKATGFAEKEWQQYAAGRAKHPAVHVVWSAAEAYCQWAGVRLPTEAQWEYAARGPKNHRYPWGAEWHGRKLCWWWNKGKDTHVKTLPVGSIREGASWCGALDLAGNVYEWCADRYGEDYYAHSPSAAPGGPDKGEERVARGGAWHSVVAIGCRSAFRIAVEPEHCYSWVGLRCVAAP